MSPSKAISVVLVAALAFAAVGTLIGAGLGSFCPGYYRAVFRDGDSPDFNPLQVGVGLGITQGVACGVATGIVILGILAWKEVRRSEAKAGKPPSDGSPARARWVRRLLGAIVVTVLVGLCSFVAFVLGGITGQQQLYQRWTDYKLERIHEILATGEFPDLEAGFSSAAQVYLTGSVKSAEERRHLEKELQLAFGTDEASEIIRLVDVDN